MQPHLAAAIWECLGGLAAASSGEERSDFQALERQMQVQGDKLWKRKTCNLGTGLETDQSKGERKQCNISDSSEGVCSGFFLLV